MDGLDNSRRDAHLALAASGGLALVAIFYLSYVLYQALVHGRSAIGKRSGHWEYLFSQDLPLAVLVLLVNLALVAAVLYTARMCYDEYLFHLDWERKARHGQGRKPIRKIP